MKNLKKIAALVIVLAMALSTVAFAFTDVAEDAGYYEAVEVMSALGLLKGYEDGTFGPDKTITRAEFAAVVVRMLGMESAAAGAAVDTIFTDVTAAHWGAGYVQVANQQGIINGYGDGKFGPDDEVTYEQAVKMIVCALGYDKMFENVPNAYPAGYISQANTIGVTVGAVGRIGDKATRAIVAKLAYNALDAKLMEQTEFGTDNTWKAVNDTLLSKNLKVAKVEATVVAQYFDKDNADKININATAGKAIYATEATGNSAATFNTFDGMIKCANAANVAKGYSNVAYIDFSGERSDWNILAIVPKSGINSTLTLTGKQLKGASLTTTEAQYYQNDAEVDVNTKKIKLDINNGSYVIPGNDLNDDGDYDDLGETAPVTVYDYNIYENKNAAGKDSTNFAAFATSWANGAIKEVTLIDNDNDSYYEYIYAVSYTANIVDKITERTGRITFKAGSVPGTFAFDFDNDNITNVIVDAEGNAIEFADIKVGDTLNIVSSVSNGATLNEITVTNNKVEGTIAEKTANGVIVAGEEYAVKAALLSGLTSGDAGVFTTDMYGEIIAFDLAAGNRNYGVVYGMYVDTNGMDAEAKAVIYTTAGEYVTYDFANYVKINGAAAVDSSTFVSGSSVVNVPTAQQIVMYSVNGANEINEIYTTNAAISARDSKLGYATVTTGNLYKASTDKIGSKYIVDSSVIIANKDVTGISAKDKLALSSKAVFDEDETAGYKYEAIVDADNNIIVALVYGATAKVDKASTPMYVTSIGDAVDAEGNSVKTIAGYVDGEYVAIKAGASTNVYSIGYKASAVATTYTPAYVVAYNTIVKGDVIQYIGEGEVADAVRVIAKYSDYKDGSLSFTSFNAADDKTEGFIAMGRVADIQRNKAITFFGGATAESSTAIIASLIKGDLATTGRIFAATYAFTDVETDLVNLGGNDDYLLVYNFDDEAKAAVIVDTAADFK